MRVRGCGVGVGEGAGRQQGSEPCRSGPTGGVGGVGGQLWRGGLLTPPLPESVALQPSCVPPACRCLCRCPPHPLAHTTTAYTPTPLSRTHLEVLPAGRHGQALDHHAEAAAAVAIAARRHGDRPAALARAAWNGRTRHEARNVFGVSSLHSYFAAWEHGPGWLCQEVCKLQRARLAMNSRRAAFDPNCPAPPPLPSKNPQNKG